MRNVLLLGLVLGLSSAIRAEEPADYGRDIKPIFQKHCITCHGPEKQESGLRLDSVKFLKRGGDRGAAFAAGKSAESLLYQSLVGKGDVSEMPAEGPKLNRDQIALIRRWIDEGAKTSQRQNPSRARKIPRRTIGRFSRSSGRRCPRFKKPAGRGIPLIGLSWRDWNAKG